MMRRPSRRVFSSEFPNLEKAYRAGRGVVSFFGDSTILGYGTGSTIGNTSTAFTGAYNTNPIARVASRLRHLNGLQGTAGFNGRGIGITGTGGNICPYYPTPMTVGAGWATNSGVQSPWGESLQNTTDTSSIVITTSEPCNRIEVLYGTFAVTGVFTIDIDGTPVDTVTLGTNGFARKTYQVAQGVHTIAFTRVSGSVFVAAGARWWNSSAPSLQLENLGVTGVSAYVSTGPAPSIYAVNTINVMGSIGADAVFLNLAINDNVAGRSAAQLKADLKLLMLACKASNIDFCPVIPKPGNTASSYNIPQSYIDAIYQLCGEVGTMAPLDLNALYVSAAASAPLYYDVVHDNPAGAIFSGDAYVAKLLGMPL